MKKLLLLFMLFVTTNAFAGGQMTLVTPDGNVFGTTSNPISVSGALSVESITDTATTHTKSRAVWIGTTQSIDFYINGAWVTFQGATAGSIIPVYATGARKTSGSAAPTAGDIVFLF